MDGDQPEQDSLTSKHSTRAGINSLSQVPGNPETMEWHRQSS
jgi:hypothetical protein